MLPKIAAVKFETTIPSTKEKVSFRPFSVKEEKMLLIGVESNDQEKMGMAMRDVVEACFDLENVSKMPYFDVEALFLALRAKSVSEEVVLTYTHRDGVNYKGEKCDGSAKLTINLDAVKVRYIEEKATSLISISDQYKVEMRYPSIVDITSLISSQKIDQTDMVARCIAAVWEGDVEHKAEAFEDSLAFVETLDPKQFAPLLNFFSKMPHVYHKAEYVCPKCGQVDTIELEGLEDFFS